MKPRLLLLTLFAIALACVEATLRVYFQELYFPDAGGGWFPFREVPPGKLSLKVGAEAASMLLILAVACLPLDRPTFTRRFAVFVFLLGGWDLAYYVWLQVFIGWPRSGLEWDLLYLIPWAWFGPWIAPALIALLFVVWGARVIGSETRYAFTPRQALLFLAGAALGLAAFLEPALPSLKAWPMTGLEGFRPDAFHWVLYGFGLALMAAGLPWRREGGFREIHIRREEP